MLQKYESRNYLILSQRDRTSNALWMEDSLIPYSIWLADWLVGNLFVCLYIIIQIYTLSSHYVTLSSLQVYKNRFFFLKKRQNPSNHKLSCSLGITLESPRQLTEPGLNAFLEGQKNGWPTSPRRQDSPQDRGNGKDPTSPNDHILDSLHRHKIPIDMGRGKCIIFAANSEH